MRITPLRDKTAALFLRGQVEANTFVKGQQQQVAKMVIDLHHEPNAESPIDTQLLLGECVTIYGSRGDWLWGQSETDQYVGWMQAADLQVPSAPATHRVLAPKTFIYPEADIKTPPIGALSLGALLCINGTAFGRGTKLPFAILRDGGVIIAPHLTPIHHYIDDHVTIAEKFLHVPYLWGGRSHEGIDCSALVQLSLRAAGIDAPRDSDMQEAELGRSLTPRMQKNLKRGDLVFWPGHVGIMRDSKTILNATASHMAVVSEPLGAVVERAGSPSSYKRMIVTSKK